MDSNLTITHTHADGTLIEGTGRGDGTAEVLKGPGVGGVAASGSRTHTPDHG